MALMGKGDLSKDRGKGWALLSQHSQGSALAERVGERGWERGAGRDSGRGDWVMAAKGCLQGFRMVENLAPVRFSWT